MTECVHSNSTKEIEIPLAPRIPEIHTPAAHKQDRLPFVGAEQKPRLRAGNRGETHALSTSVPHSNLVK